jgi:predicted transcriptional regulator
MKKIHEKYKNAYKPWGKEEEQRLLNLFNEKKSISEISEVLERQPSAIEAKLIKLGELK